LLTELHIEHLGVIERVTLVVGPGLTVVSGETGAGKTMIVEAIELLVGGRADPAMVRAGAVEARVDGRFVDGDVELVLSRVVPGDGRSRAYVNGRLATATTLSELAAGLVDLHGQHAHQRLLDAAAQREALDEFGRIDLAPLRAARARVTELDAELAALGGDERARAREIDLLRYQVVELDAAGLDDPEEDAGLALTEDALADAAAHRDAGAGAHAALTADAGSRDGLATSASLVAGRSPYAEVASRLASLLAELDDAAAEIRRIAESIEDDPERLAEVRARRQQLRDLERKYGDDLPAVIAFRDEARHRLSELETFDERAAELDSARAAALVDERAAAERVAAARRAAAPELAAAVVSRLRTLALPHADVAVEVGADAPGDRVEFLLSANPGSSRLPLARVASGGELARAMLALRLVLARRVGDAPRTLVFDEVDAGIGGRAATAVGEALADLAQTDQVLVVTHLAQIAARASSHVVVTKHVEGDTTTARAELVDGDRRVSELARMLSGSVATDAARRHALELLERP
jgi:DNA repair protein RecN (Recombination protein N)